MIFKDKVSLVTGASQGIGEAIAEELGRAGGYCGSGGYPER